MADMETVVEVANELGVTVDDVKALAARESFCWRCGAQEEEIKGTWIPVILTEGVCRDCRRQTVDCR